MPSYLMDYLVEEVLEHRPGPIRDFLLRTAVLDRLTGSLCDTLTDRTDGSDLLTSLERANLFLVPLDDRREWYRYHHLFADVLRARLLAERPELLPLLHQRASGWYERHDLAHEAVKHALAAGDFDRAARLVELAVPAIRRDRHVHAVGLWQSRRGRAQTHRCVTRPGCATGRLGPPLGARRRAQRLTGNHRRMPRSGGPSTRRYPWHHRTRPTRS